MMKLTTYDKYKDSEIEWLGDVPEHWEKTQMKRVLFLLTDYDANGSFSTIKDNVNRVVNEEEQFAWFVRATDFTNYLEKNPKQDFVWVDEKTYYFLRKSYLTGGELLIAKRGEIGKVYYMPKVNFHATLGPNTYLARLNKRINSRFAFYIFKSNYGYSQLVVRNKSTAIGAIYKDDFKSIEILLPSPTEQTQIANYLDQATIKIDKKIDLLTQKIKHYQNLKTALINRVVTKGLDDSVEMKDSGVEWVGKIPKHWEVKRMKDIGYLYSGLSGKKGDDFRKDDSPLNRPFIKFTNISNDIIVETKNFGQVEIESDETQNKVQKGDIFFLMSSEGYEDIGKSALLNEELDEVYLNSFCKGFRISNKSIIPSYLNFLLASDDIRHNIICEGKGFTRINLRMSKIQCLNFLAPPIIEQQKIVEYLNKKTSIIDKIIATITKQIEHQKELRKTLINDVVTGKVKVENS